MKPLQSLVLLQLTLLMMVSVACNKKQSTVAQSEGTHNSSLRDTGYQVRFQTGLKLPVRFRSKNNIRHYMDSIDRLVDADSLNIETLFGYLNGPCEVLKASNSSDILMVSYGCGDCSPKMRNYLYYFKNNELVASSRYLIQYRYIPCASMKELDKEYGIDTNKLNDLTSETWEHFYILDSTSYCSQLIGDSFLNNVDVDTSKQIAQFLYEANSAYVYIEKDDL